MPLDSAEIERRVLALRSSQSERVAQVAGAQGALTARNIYVHPLSDAADSAIETIENTEERFKLGLDAIDLRTRGFGPKELVLITGFAHAGKTQLINTAILHNRNKRVLFFSMDDPAEMILLKLVCMKEGVDAETLEQRIREGDHKSKLALKQAATHVFDKLIVVDDSLGLQGMDRAIEEATRLWGYNPECVVIDYLASMRGTAGTLEDDGIKSKVADLKRWVKDKPFPTIVLHQNTRSRGGPGEPITMMSGGYGGEAEATFVLGVRRKRDATDLDDRMRDVHRDTITIHLVKNKRPPGKLSHPDGIDFYMAPSTGLIRPLGDGDIPIPRHNLHTAQEGLRAAA